jgi:hypothetical protein
MISAHGLSAHPASLGGRKRLPSACGDERPLLLSQRGEGSRATGARGGVRSTGGASASRVNKPHLDEMHGPESLPYRPGHTPSRKPAPDDISASPGSKIFQPTDSRQSGPNSAPPRGPAAARQAIGVDGRSGRSFFQLRKSQLRQSSLKSSSSSSWLSISISQSLSSFRTRFIPYFEARNSTSS